MNDVIDKAIGISIIALIWVLIVFLLNGNKHTIDVNFDDVYVNHEHSGSVYGGSNDEADDKSFNFTWTNVK